MRPVLSASIRGIGQDDFAMNLHPGVGVYVDGVANVPHTVWYWPADP
jgi:hypothetical protein